MTALKEQNRSIKPHEICQESGFSIIQLLVVMGVMTLSISVVMQSRVNADRTEKSARSAARSQDVDQIISHEIRGILQQLLPSHCLTETMIENRPILGSGSTARMQFQTNLQETPQRLRRSGIVSHDISGEAPLQAASGRCNQPRFIPGSEVTQNSSNQLYFCVEFTRDPSAPSESFLQSHHAFAEFAINLLNLHNNSRLSCRNFIDFDIAGAQVFYSLYWLTMVGDQVQYRRRNNVVYIQK